MEGVQRVEGEEGTDILPSNSCYAKIDITTVRFHQHYQWISNYWAWGGGGVRGLLAPLFLLHCDISTD